MYQREKTNKQATLSVLISTVLLSRAVVFCPKFAGPKGKQNEQRFNRNGKRLASAFSREDRAIRTQSFQAPISPLLPKYPFCPFTKEGLWTGL